MSPAAPWGMQDLTGDIRHHETAWKSLFQGFTPQINVVFFEDDEHQWTGKLNLYYNGDISSWYQDSLERFVLTTIIFTFYFSRALLYKVYETLFVFSELPDDGKGEKGFCVE